jgi:hypothetical protein
VLKRIPLFCQETGYSPKAVARKIEDGVWVEGREYVRAPDGRRLIDMEGYEAWARGEAQKPKKKVFLGLFDTDTEAHVAYVQAKGERHPGNTL